MISIKKVINDRGENIRDVKFYIKENEKSLLVRWEGHPCHKTTLAIIRDTTTSDVCESL